jgi:hypothetical protein
VPRTPPGAKPPAEPEYKERSDKKDTWVVHWIEHFAHLKWRPVINRCAWMLAVAPYLGSLIDSRFDPII